jgi:polyisoprenoid-binding protein YceI
MNNKLLRPTLYLGLLIAFQVAGCKDPADSVPAAQVKAKTQPQASEARQPQQSDKSGALSFSLTAENTQVHFVGSKVTGSHEGGFKSLSGELTLGETLNSSRATITIDMKSIYTDSEKLTGHLRSPDFFDVEKFPTATFAITTVEEKELKDGTRMLSGELTLHGVTRPIRFPATIEAAKGDLTANAEFSINRKDFDITYPGVKDDLIRDGVVIKLKLALRSRNDG